MKDYRVYFINGHTGRRSHKDFVTLKGAMSFASRIGLDSCIVQQYNPQTFTFDNI